MKTPIIYVLIASENNLYLEEMWASLYSLRAFHPEVEVLVLTDYLTATKINERNALSEMITEVIIVEIPEVHSLKEKSREIKTSVRNIIEGTFLFIDTDTIITKRLDEIDNLKCDIAAVPDAHTTLKEHPFGNTVRCNVKQIFNEDISGSSYWFNSGVMYVADNERTRTFYKRWNENWTYSTFEKKCSQDQPALVKTDKEFGYIIEELPGEYNCQLALSVRYFYEARIVHFWHMDFIPNQDYSPFMGLEIYRKIRESNGISTDVAEQICNCKSAFKTTTMIVGQDQIYFLFSITGQMLSQLHQNNPKWSIFLDWIAGRINLYYRAKRKIKKLWNT